MTATGTADSAQVLTEREGLEELWDSSAPPGTVDRSTPTTVKRVAFCVPILGDPTGTSGMSSKQQESARYEARSPRTTIVSRIRFGTR